MKTFITFALKRPVSVIMAATAILGLGIVAAFSLQVDFYPELSVPSILVSAAYPGSDARTVRQTVTVPLEDGLASLPGVKDIRSVTRPGNAIIELTFDWGTDMVLAGVRVREAVDGRYPLLPDGAEKPRIIPADPNKRPLATLAAIPRSGDLVFARTLAEREIKTALQQVSGVGSIILVGGLEREVRVEVTENLVSVRGLSVPALASAIRAEIVRVPAGTVREGSLDYVVATDAEPASLEELGAVPIGPGGLVLGDVADVRMDFRERDSAFFVNGQEAVGMVVRGREGTNPVETADALARELEILEGRYGHDIDFVVLEDGTEPIRSVIKALGFGLATGAAAALFVLLLSVRDIRTALVILASIPFSVAATLAAMGLFGVGVNTMSLGGLALGLGMIVDTSVVVVERLMRKRGGESDVEAVVSVSGASFGSTLTSIIVFSPVFFLPGILGALYKDLAFTVVLALASSYLVSISLIPVLARWAGVASGRRGSEAKIYRRVLKAVLRRPWGAILAAVLVTAAGVWGMSLLPTEFSPKTRSGILYAKLDFPENARLEWVADQGEALSSYLLTIPGVTSVFGRVGGEDEDVFYKGNAEEYAGRLSITAVYDPKQPESAEVLERTLGEIAARLGAAASFSADSDPLEDLLGIGGQGTLYPVSGNDPDAAESAARAVAARMVEADVPARVRRAADAEGISFFPLRDKNAAVGVSSRDLALALRASVEGMPAGIYREGGRDFPVTVALPDDIRRDPARIGDLVLIADGTRTVKASELFEIRREDAPTRFLRIGRKDVVPVFVDAPADPAMDRMAGETKASDRSVLEAEAARIGFLLVAGLSVLYLFLGAVFESWAKPFLILSTVPVALAGTAAALALGGYSLNIQSGLGVLVLMGLVVNNAILLTDAIGRLGGGYAVFRAATTRLRPILITSATTVLALLPTALGIFGSSPQSGLAAAVAGGLAVSTAVSLFLIPVLSVRNSGTGKRRA